MTPNYIIAGIKVFITESCGSFVARRKHKKRRIKKKWLKKYGKIFEPCSALVVADLCGERVIFCHPKYWVKFNEKFEKFKVTSHIENIFSNDCSGCEYINDDGGYCYDCYNCGKKRVKKDQFQNCETGSKGAIGICPICKKSDGITWIPEKDICTCTCGWNNAETFEIRGGGDG